MVGLMRPWQYSRGCVEDGRGLDDGADEVEAATRRLLKILRAAPGAVL
jgi:hypothetical protein